MSLKPKSILVLLSQTFQRCTKWQNQWLRISLAMQGTDQGAKIPLATVQLNLWVMTRVRTLRQKSCVPPLTPNTTK